MTITTASPDRIDAHRLLVQASDGRTTSDYKSGQAIYSEGEEAETVFFVQHGSVEIAISSKNVLKVLGIANEGQFFGATCLYEVPRRIATATAITESRITSVKKSALLIAIREKPKFAKMFTDHLWHNAIPQKELLGRLLKCADAA